MTTGTYIAFHPFCMTVKVKYQWEVWSGACLSLLLPFKRRHLMLEFSGSLKAPQLQVGLLETPREVENLVLFHPQPFCDSAKHLHPRGSERQVKWPQPGSPSALLSGQASCGRMRIHIHHCSWDGICTANCDVVCLSV